MSAVAVAKKDDRTEHDLVFTVQPKMPHLE